MTESLFQGDTDYNAQAERDRRYQEAYEEAAERFGIEPENLIDLEQFERYERERAERQQYTPEQEVVMKSTHPEEVKLAMRQYSEKMEASITEAPTLDDKYAALRIYWSAINRASALEAGVKDRPIKRIMHYSEDGIVLSNLIPEPQKPKVLVSEETHNIAQVFTALPKNTPESVLSTLSATLIAANLEIQRRNDERRKRHELELEKYRLDQVRFLKVEARRVPLIDTLREEAELLAS